LTIYLVLRCYNIIWGVEVLRYKECGLLTFSYIDKAYGSMNLMDINQRTWSKTVLRGLSLASSFCNMLLRSDIVSMIKIWLVNLSQLRKLSGDDFSVLRQADNMGLLSMHASNLFSPNITCLNCFCFEINLILKWCSNSSLSTLIWNLESLM